MVIDKMSKREESLVKGISLGFSLSQNILHAHSVELMRLTVSNKLIQIKFLSLSVKN